MPDNDEIRALVKELRSAAGVGYSVESLEVFLLFPDTFRRRYAQLCAQALKGAVEDGPGRTLEAEAGVGRAKVPGKYKGKRVGAGAGGQGKRYKTFWTVRNENALGVKAKIDRRLRALARDIEEMLEAREGIVRRADEATTKGNCSGCGRFVEREWTYCPNCGTQLRTRIENDGPVPTGGS